MVTKRTTSQDYMSEKGKIIFFIQELNPFLYYPDLKQAQDQQCGVLSEKDLKTGHDNNLDKSEEEESNHLMMAMETENIDEDEGSYNDGTRSFRKNPHYKWPNNLLPYEIG